jgi:hypothetical protein
VNRLRVAGADGVSEQTTPAANDDTGSIRLTPYRRIDVRAVITPDGYLCIGRNRFRADQLAGLRQFVSKLKREGVPKPDPSQPLWGLSETQFDRLQERLREPSQFELDQLPLRTFLQQLARRTGMPVKTTRQVQRAAHTIRLTARTGRVSLGAATAYALGQVGLAFEPRADADGSLSLLVLTREESARPWPIGLKPEGMRGRIAPQLLKFIELKTVNSSLDQIIGAIRQNLELDVLVDLAAMRAAGIDPGALRSSAKLPRSTWSSAIRRVLHPLGLVYELRIDEANRPFLWVTVMPGYKAKAKRQPSQQINVPQ